MPSGDDAAANEPWAPASSDAPHILVVDDERVIREILAEFLTLEGYAVRTVEDGEKALTELRLRPYDLVITDLKMPRISGLQLLEKIGQENIQVLTILMTGFGTVETAIEAMKRGAYDYLLKPFKVEEVIQTVQRALDRQQLQAENMRLREALTIYRVSEAIALSTDVDRVLDVVLRAAIDEARADVATLHLRDLRTGRYEERIKVVSEKRSVGGLPTPQFSTLLEHFQQGLPLVAHGARAARFFSEGRVSDDLASYLAVPLQVGGNMVGVLNVFSFTPGKKFDEGHRKMLAVLASRAASAIDNARLYTDLRASNEDLRRANQSLEEIFQQTVAGFAQALEETDLYTRGHSERVAVYSEIIGRGLQLGELELQRLIQADRRALRHAEQARQTDGRGDRRVSSTPGKGQTDPGTSTVPARAHRWLLVPPRMVRWWRISAWALRAEHPVGWQNHRGRRRIRRDDFRSGVSPRAPARSRNGGDRTLCGVPVRPRDRRHLRQADHGVAEADERV
jgi:DNA-binding response OmpR family regulator